MKSISYLFKLIISFTIISAPAYAGDITFHGFVQGNLSARITGEETPDSSEGGDYLSGEQRLRGEITGSSESAAFTLKADLVHDSISDEDSIDIREGYIDYRSTNYDLRAGRQIITWGAGDLLFINDTYPKNYSALFSGQPLEYLKTGSDALKLSVYSDIISADLVIIPFFEPYQLPDSKRFFPDNPMNINIKTKTPREEIENSEIALRVYRQLGRFDTSIYLYRGFYKIPGMRQLSQTEAELIYPQLAVYGFSMQGAFAYGVLSIEGGYYDSLDDRNGDDIAISNSSAKYILGYSKQLWTDFTAGVQYYGEYMQDYGRYENSLSSLPPGSDFPKSDKLHNLITLRLTQMLKYNTLRLSLFSFYSPDEEDYFVIPEARYNITDSLWTSIGANIFGGKNPRTFFGQLDKNDNMFATIRYEF
ncbi:MAG TPA: hypothetical protein VFF47_03100 [Nitrospirota bacterium]|nr:hypothetical protein [Nitrospirota bacterium]